MTDNAIPKSLRHWFIIHFIIDTLFAVPLMLFPAWLLQVLGFDTANVLFARLIGAALVAIGGTSLAMHKKEIPEYRAMLQLKLLWSGTAIIGIILSLKKNKIGTTWLFLIIFIFFFLLWAYYWRQLSKK